MDMENKKVKNLLQDAAERIAARAEANKGYEYENYFLTVNYAAIKGGHVRQIGLRAFGLFIVLRTFMNKEGVAFPKLSTLCRYSGLSINTIQKDVDILIKNGWVKKTVTRKKDGTFEVARYFILQKDLIRGTGDPSFKKSPVSRSDNGD